MDGIELINLKEHNNDNSSNNNTSDNNDITIIFIYTFHSNLIPMTITWINSILNSVYTCKYICVCTNQILRHTYFSFLGSHKD